MRYITSPPIRDQLFIAPKFRSASDKKRRGRLMAYDDKFGSKLHQDEEVAPPDNSDAIGQIAAWAQANLSQEEIRNLRQTLGAGSPPEGQDQEKSDKTQEITALCRGKLTPDEIELLQQLLAGEPGALNHPLLRDHRPAWQSVSDDPRNSQPRSGSFGRVGALGADSAASSVSRMLAEAGSRIKIGGYGGYPASSQGSQRPMAHDVKARAALLSAFPDARRIRV